MAFLTGGSHIWEQQLSPHTTQLNQSLLIIALVFRSNISSPMLITDFSVMSLVLPSAYFTALDRGLNTLQPGVVEIIITDKVRGNFLKMSRATAILLLLM